MKKPKPRLVWRRQPAEKGLARVGQGERGDELRCQGETLGGAYPVYRGFSREKIGYCCSGRWDEMGVPLINTASQPVATIEEAKEQLRAHFDYHLDLHMNATEEQAAAQSENRTEPKELSLDLLIEMLAYWRRERKQVVIEHRGQRFSVNEVKPDGDQVVIRTRPEPIGAAPPPSLPHVVVSRSFPNSGDWIVHVAGPNRNPKLAFLPEREQAEEFASRINALLRQVVEEHQRD